MDKTKLLMRLDFIIASLNWPLTVALQTDSYTMTDDELQTIYELLADTRSYIENT